MGEVLVTLKGVSARGDVQEIIDGLVAQFGDRVVVTHYPRREKELSGVKWYAFLRIRKEVEHG